MFGLNLVYISLCADCPIEISKIIVFSSCSFCQVNRVLMKIQYPKPRYDPFSVSLISLLLLKELVCSFHML